MSVRPSVRLSVGHVGGMVDCIHAAKDIVKLLSRSGSPVVLDYFYPQASVPNSKGKPFSDGAKYIGWGKFCDFRLKSPCISETVRDSPIVDIER